MTSNEASSDFFVFTEEDEKKFNETLKANGVGVRKDHWGVIPSDDALPKGLWEASGTPFPTLDTTDLDVKEAAHQREEVGLEAAAAEDLANQIKNKMQKSGNSFDLQAELLRRYEQSISYKVASHEYSNEYVSKEACEIAAELCQESGIRGVEVERIVDLTSERCKEMASKGSIDFVATTRSFVNESVSDLSGNLGQHIARSAIIEVFKREEVASLSAMLGEIAAIEHDESRYRGYTRDQRLSMMGDIARGKNQGRQSKEDIRQAIELCNSALDVIDLKMHDCKSHNLADTYQTLLTRLQDMSHRASKDEPVSSFNGSSYEKILQIGIKAARNADVKPVVDGVATLTGGTRILDGAQMHAMDGRDALSNSETTLLSRVVSLLRDQYKLEPKDFLPGDLVDKVDAQHASAAQEQEAKDVNLDFVAKASISASGPSF